MPARQLIRLRWAVRAVLTLAVAASITANILHAQPTPIGRSIAAWPPLALLLTIELISRVPVHRPVLAAVRLIATTGIAGIAAWVSYWHMVGVIGRYGETGAAPYLIPLSVDGLVAVASVCLVEIAGRLRALATAPAPRRAPATEATPAPKKTTRPRTRSKKAGPTTARTDDELIAALAGVPREPDGTVPVRRAAAALGTGPDRARRLLDTAGLRHPTTTTDPVAA